MNTSILAKPSAKASALHGKTHLFALQNTSFCTAKHNVLQLHQFSTINNKYTLVSLAKRESDYFAQPVSKGFNRITAGRFVYFRHYFSPC
jgi:hypothetical protein